MLATPKKYSLVSGFGEALTLLNAFDAALINAGIGNLNLLKVSSILPPGAKYAERLEIPVGSLTPTAYGSICSKKPGELIAAAVAVGVPWEDTFGVIMECSAIGTKEEIIGRIHSMVEAAFAIRRLELKEIKVAAVEHQVVECGCAFAGVPLWY